MNPTFDFTGKVAFVTGAGSGIGRATAIAFAAAGASVAIVDIAETGLAETATLISAAGGKSVSLRADVTKSAEIKAALDQTIAAGKTVRASLKVPIAVFLLYWTAYVTPDGQVNFRDDPYGWDRVLVQRIAAGASGSA